MKNNLCINILKIISVIVLIFETVAVDLNLTIKLGASIFILCAGIKFLRKDIEIKKLLITSLSLYLVYIFWNITYNVLISLINGDLIGNSELFYIIKDILLLNTTYHFWILKYIIILLLSTIILKHIIDRNKILDTVILIITFLLPIFNDAFILLFAYVAGYYFTRYHNKYLSYIIIVLNIVSIILFRPYLNLLLPILLLIFFRFISKYINNTFKIIISFMQVQNFGIFLIFGIVLEIINLINLNNTGISNLLGITTLTYLLSIITITWFNFLPFVENLVKERI